MIRPGIEDSSRRDFSTKSRYASGMLHSNTIQVRENSRQFTLTVELQEVDQASLDLWLENHHLTVMADTYFGSIDLPGDVDEDTIEAELKNAQLSISFRKCRAGYPSEF